MGTYAITEPFDDIVYMAWTITLKFYAEHEVPLISTTAGPVHTEVYVVEQPVGADTDHDGIPDRFEIGDDGRARVGFDHARELHGQGRCAGDDAPATRVGPQRAPDGHRIDTGVIEEPLVLRGDSRLDQPRADLVV